MSTSQPWAPGSGTNSFTPPPASTTEPVRPGKSTSTKGSTKKGRIVNIALSMLVVVLLIGAGILVWQAFTPADSSAPIPESEFEVPLQDPVGAAGDSPVPMDDGSQMTVADMEPNTMFIPALGVYMPVQADSTFVSSRYSDFDTLKVPSNPRRAAHYAGGAPLVGGDAGTTLVAAHVSTGSGWGSLRYLYTLTGGELIYTKDAEGQVQEWQLTKMRVEQHTDFPQEYWSNEGERQLVVTTCGGPMTKDRHFLKNIFAIATPVDADPEPADDTQSDVTESTEES
ncbi:MULTISPECIES: class F sortase [unclassified Microbacterium]|uniref:class F sortase n=1 Tax=unclassified Microbacterium TaxID=2609290 RepID=UPI002883165C|nr:MULTISPECIES: class F sortase [unclassified Microbacterium]